MQLSFCAWAVCGTGRIRRTAGRHGVHNEKRGRHVHNSSIGRDRRHQRSSITEIMLAVQPGR